MGKINLKEDFTYSIAHHYPEAVRHVKRIGMCKYRFSIYLGDCGEIKSSPQDIYDDLYKYSTVGVCLERFHEGFDCFCSMSLKELDSRFDYPTIGYEKFYNYELTIPALEEVWGKLLELNNLGSSSNVKREKACKRCGRMNDESAEVCWGFTCGMVIR
jgi:hypothetical protein